MAIKIPTIAKDFLRGAKKTPVFLAIIGAALLGRPSYFMSVDHETKRERAMIPLSFSHIDQIEQEARQRGDTLSLVNELLPKVNDASMKIFEAKNNANGLAGDFHEKFAYELRDAMNNEKGYPYGLRDLLDEIPKLGNELIREKLMYKNASLISQKLRKQADESWTYRSVDNYHTEVYTTTDSEGNTTMHTRQVYDDTDHYFKYYSKHGENAAKLGKYYEDKISGLGFKKIHHATQTHRDGEQAAIKSRKDNEKVNVDSLNFVNIAKSWLTYSSLLKNDKNIVFTDNMLRKAIHDWNVKRFTAKNKHYNTYSSRHSGPIEYQSAKKLEDKADDMVSYVTRFKTTVGATSNKVNELKPLIEDYISKVQYMPSTVSEKQRNKELNKLKKQIMRKSIDMYKLNFEGAEEIKEFRPWAVAGFTLLGLSLGAALGLGSDKTLRAIGAYDLVSKKNSSSQNQDEYSTSDYSRDY